MAKDFEGQVAIVTGGAVRIGRAIGRALAGAGCGVVVHYRSSAREAADAVREFHSLGVPAWRVRAELSREAGCRALMRSARDVAGRLDILVNSAAVFHKDALKDVSEAKLLVEFRANLFAPVLLTRYFAAAARRGRIVNVLDRRIASHDPTCIPYLLSKKALAAFTEVAALALAPRFTVNGVAPGPILPPPGKGRSYLKDQAGPVPLGGTFTPDDVAASVLMLLRSPRVTGQIVYVDGGQHLLGNRQTRT